MTRRVPWRRPTFRHAPRTAVLTTREADVLGGICLGLSNAAIGQQLGISEETVKSRIKTLYVALGASSRTHAVVLASSPHVRIVVEVPQ